MRASRKAKRPTYRTHEALLFSSTINFNVGGVACSSRFPRAMEDVVAGFWIVRILRLLLWIKHKIQWTGGKGISDVRKQKERIWTGCLI